jgi:hemolysin activation/secretion protein
MRSAFFLLILVILLNLAGYAEAAGLDDSVVARYVDPLDSRSGKLYTLSKIRFAGIALINNDLLTSEEIERVAGPFKGKDISFEQLEIIRHELTKIIIGKGFVNSGIIIPDQEVKDGIIQFTVIRGSLTSVELEGNRHFSSGYLKSKLERGVRQPLNVKILQENLQLLQLDPRIIAVKAELKPGDRPGESILKAHIEESLPITLRLESSNSDSPSIGSYRGDVIVSYSNLIGTGDIIEGRFGIADDIRDYGVRFSIPLNSIDTTLEGYFRRGQSTVVEDLFRNLDIKSTDDTYGVRISQPFVFSLSHQLKVSLAGEYRTSTTSLLGRNFSFSAGADDGKSKLTAIRFTQEYVNRMQDQVFAISSSLNFGIDALGATIHTDGQPDSRFFSWLAQALYIRQLGQTQLVFRSDAQLSNDKLLTMEKLSVGGIGSVRGYRKSLLVRDNGVSATLESRIPLLSSSRGEPIFSLIPFYDCGYSWDSGNDPSLRDDFIHSIGAGFKWSPIKGAVVEFYYGYALRKIEVTEHDPQDYGIHFNVSWQVF